MAGILTKQVLLRISEEEAAEWQKLADAAGVDSLPLFVRRVMASACGQPEMIERVERQVAEAKVHRANHMRAYLPPRARKSA